MSVSLAAIDRAVAKLDAIDASDPERAHGEADDILLYYADTEIAAAYERLQKRCSWWADA